MKAIERERERESLFCFICFSVTMTVKYRGGWILGKNGNVGVFRAADFDVMKMKSIRTDLFVLMITGPHLCFSYSNQLCRTQKCLLTFTINDIPKSFFTLILNWFSLFSEVN